MFWHNYEVGQLLTEMVQGGLEPNGTWSWLIWWRCCSVLYLTAVRAVIESWEKTKITPRLKIFTLSFRRALILAVLLIKRPLLCNWLELWLSSVDQFFLAALFLLLSLYLSLGSTLSLVPRADPVCPWFCGFRVDHLNESAFQSPPKTPHNSIQLEKKNH